MCITNDVQLILLLSDGVRVLQQDLHRQTQLRVPPARRSPVGRAREMSALRRNELYVEGGLFPPCAQVQTDCDELSVFVVRHFDSKLCILVISYNMYIMYIHIFESILVFSKVIMMVCS